jgi:predicted transglutaminase-like cysteine proteinase
VDLLLLRIPTASCLADVSYRLLGAVFLIQTPCSVRLSLTAYTLEQQIRLVNRYINKQRYKDDRISSKSVAVNQWETLTEFLHRGGDCEDFAVPKYFVPIEFGVDAMDMRIVIGREAQRATHHAMLAIKFDDDVWLLENDNTIHKNGYQDIEEFVYALNEQGIWDHEIRD